MHVNLPRHKPSVCLLVLCCLSSRLCSSLAHTFKIDPYMDECFYIYTPKSKAIREVSLAASYEMIDETGELSGEPMLVYVMDASTQELKYTSPKGRKRGNFNVALRASHKYWLCAQNNNRGPEDEDAEHPDNMARTVGLSYQLIEGSASPADDPLDPNRQKLATWLDNANKVKRELKVLADQFSYAKRREKDQREVAEATFTEIMTWTVLEAVAVCGVALGQVLMYRMFLEKKRYM